MAYFDIYLALKGLFMLKWRYTKVLFSIYSPRHKEYILSQTSLLGTAYTSIIPKFGSYG